MADTYIYAMVRGQNSYGFRIPVGRKKSLSIINFKARTIMLNFMKPIPPQVLFGIVPSITRLSALYNR